MERKLDLLETARRKLDGYIEDLNRSIIRARYALGVISKERTKVECNPEFLTMVGRLRLVSDTSIICTKLEEYYYDHYKPEGVYLPLRHRFYGGKYLGNAKYYGMWVSVPVFDIPNEIIDLILDDPAVKVCTVGSNKSSISIPGILCGVVESWTSDHYIVKTPRHIYNKVKTWCKCGRRGTDNDDEYKFIDPFEQQHQEWLIRHRLTRLQRAWKAHLRYRPGGEGYEESCSNFKQLQNQTN